MQRSLPSVANLVTYQVVPEIGGIWNHLKNRSKKLYLDFFFIFLSIFLAYIITIMIFILPKNAEKSYSTYNFQKSIPKHETQNLGTQSITLAAMMTNHEFSQPPHERKYKFQPVPNNSFCARGLGSEESPSLKCNVHLDDRVLIIVHQ